MDFTKWYQSVMPKEVISIQVLFEYHTIAPVLKQWKYHRDYDCEMQIIQAFTSAIQYLPHFQEKSSVIYIPLGIDRWKTRGFNQSKRLAEILGNTLGFTLFWQIYRFWSGDHESLLTKQERLARNFEFFIPPFVKVPNHVILVDDVISTGATLRACSEYLVSRGCTTISIVSLARSSEAFVSLRASEINSK